MGIADGQQQDPHDCTDRRAEYARISELRDHMDTRFNEMRDLWRSELYRVEQVIDARLKHLEERG
jgi:hypothetical protein